MYSRSFYLWTIYVSHYIGHVVPLSPSAFSTPCPRCPTSKVNMSASTTTETRTSPPQNRNRRNNRGRGRGGHNKAAQRGDNKTAPTTNEAAPNSATDEAIKSPTAPNVHDTNASAAPNDDAAICWICAEPVKYYSVSSCNHRTCHVCALRLRALYKKLECTFCKVRFTISFLPILFRRPRRTGASIDGHLHHFT